MPDVTDTTQTSNTQQVSNAAPKRTFLLRRARMEAGLTQIELASQTHMSVNTLSKLENQELSEWPKKSIGTMLRIARMLGLPPSELYLKLGKVPKEEEIDYGL